MILFRLAKDVALNSLQQSESCSHMYGGPSVSRNFISDFKINFKFKMEIKQTHNHPKRLNARQLRMRRQNISYYQAY